VINAANLQSGALWRFSKPYMRDYLVGNVKDPNVRLDSGAAPWRRRAEMGLSRYERKGARRDDAPLR
jgi:hypothetical protein